MHVLPLTTDPVLAAKVSDNLNHELNKEAAKEMETVLEVTRRYFGVHNGMTRDEIESVLKSHPDSKGVVSY